MIATALKFTFVIVLFDFPFSTTQQSPTVSTKHGRIQGSLVQVPNLQDVYQFTGIPYAEPPVGERRFQKPLYKSPWNNTLDATKRPPACIQPSGYNLMTNFTRASILPGVDFSEDCLYLNIWVPQRVLDDTMAGNSHSPVPVFIFIYGGAFISGATMMTIYNGSVLAAYGNVVVATVAYRVGQLGFAYFGSKEAPGNQGLWDQQMGMRWIHDNIDAFGGLNSQITLGGENAGSASVSLHLLSPSSRQYFQGAIMQSGTATSPWAFHTRDEALASSRRIFSQTASSKCGILASVTDQLRCLRTLPPDVFPVVDTTSFESENGFGAAPVFDGDFLFSDPRTMISRGDISDIPLMIGTNKDEATVFFAMKERALKLAVTAEQFPTQLNKTDYESLLEIVLNILSTVPQPINPSLLEAILLLYRPTSDQSAFPTGRMVVESVNKAATDYAFKCPTFAFANAASAQRNSPVFVYQYTHRASFSPEWMGVGHGDELPFVFGLPLTPSNSITPFSVENKQFSKTVLTYWSNFIKSGDPNRASGNDNSTRWTPFTSESCATFVLDTKSSSTLACNEFRNCQFWDRIYPRLTAAIGRCA